MKVTYDTRTDTLSVVLRELVAVAESDEDKPGVILDYDEAGNLISLEILDASKRVTETRKMEFHMKLFIDGMLLQLPEVREENEQPRN